MAIAFQEQALPSPQSLSFDITHWGGLNKIKGGQSQNEMADCKNMSSDLYPYASPRKARKKVVSESGIKRIYKADGEKIYCIDAENRLCCFENGVKTLLKSKYGETEEQIYIYNCACSNNYDDCSVFYPEMAYTDYEGNYRSIDKPVSLTKRFSEYQNVNPTSYNYVRYDPEYLQHEYKDSTATQVTYSAIDLKSDKINVENIGTRSFSVCCNLPKSEEGKYKVPMDGAYKRPTVRARVYDKNDKIRFYNIQNSDGTVMPKEMFFGQFPEIDRQYNRCDVVIPDEITLEKGDYIIFTVGFYSTSESDFSNSPTYKRCAGDNMTYMSTGEWFIGMGSDHRKNIADTPLEYGAVFNNRIVGVEGSNIKASALGEFSNFWEYADEAGNPSATGAYATDVGSQGRFTAICVYNNMLLLFKRNIVYEMYGSMPYTITELCSTGCIDNDSICEIDGILYWASPKGIVRYSGGVPSVISEKTDIDTSVTCKAGTDGRKYYAFDGRKVYVYDTRYNLWHTEETPNLKMFYGDMTTLYMLLDDGIYTSGGKDERVEWEFETGDYTFGREERKNLSKLWVRADMKANTALEIYVRQDGGEWKRTAVKTAEEAEMFDFKLRVKKCDSFALKFKGRGDVRILDIHGRVSVGTSKHRSGSSLNVYRR